MDDQLFNRSLTTLERYADVYAKTIQMRDSNSDREQETHKRLSNLITDLINHLWDNAKGQI